MPPLRQRVPVTEYEPSAAVIPALREAGLDTANAVARMTRLASTLKRHFSPREEESPIAIDGETVKVMNLAGVLRLSPHVELDLAPKFLGHTYSGWREDFLTIANLTGHGRILSTDRVSAMYGQSADLASLIGRSFVVEYHENRRAPLRTYRKRRWRDYDLYGELDIDGLANLGMEGFDQTAVVLDGVNAFNAVIRGAAEALLSEVRDPGVRNQIARIRESIPLQGPPRRRLPRLPGRHRAWRPLIELSLQVLEGFDVRLQEDHVMAPGFLVRTWQAWERLVYLALRLARGDDRAAFQEEHPWAKRGETPIFVRPDVTLLDAGLRAPVDAKYKTRIDRSNQRISQADLMEVSAFIEACDARSAVLLYPRAVGDEADSPEPCGTCRPFDQVEIGTRTIIALDVEVRGIGKRGGYRTFADNLSAEVEHHHPAVQAAVTA